MNKSTPSRPEFSAQSQNDKERLKKLPAVPSETAIANIMAFAKSYSVRNSKELGKLEFMLN
jgi:hypothetical protein